MTTFTIDAESNSKPPESAKPKGGRKPAKKAKAAKKTAPAKKAARKPKTDRTNKKAEVIATMQRAKGATLDEIMKATGWQPHYADVRIMPTCIENPACGAGIAAMESA